MRRPLLALPVAAMLSAVLVSTAGCGSSASGGAGSGGVASSKGLPLKVVAAGNSSTASKKVADGQPDLVKRFTQAMARSLAYAQAHPDQARTALTTYTKIDAATAAKLTLPAWPSDINRQSVDTLAQLALGDGLVSKQPDVAALLP